MRLMTTADAGRALGVTSTRVRQLILAGRLPALRVGRDWLIRERDLARVADRRPGRPVTTGAGLRRRRHQAVDQKGT
jgi:excisionase family DNA binding protein